MYNSFKQVREALAASETSCRSLVEYYLKNIREKSDLNAYLEVFENEAISRADEIDAKIAAGSAGRLAGMVVGIKDVLCYRDHKLQAASKILDGFVSQYTATAVERLLAEDVIILGRLNCDEFAMGSTNENSAFGPTLNAADKTKVPGGSSGGSAVAVQADLCMASLGSDTGGSVRQPASFCGVYGLKPTYSRISRFGLIAYASSFDAIGIFSKNIDDAALLLEITAGADESDATVSREPVPAYSENTDFSGKAKIAYFREAVESPSLAPDVKARTLEKVNYLREQGHTVEAVDFPLMKHILPTYYILITAEASTNLSRYDGVRYGYRSPDATDLESMYKKSRSEGFGEEVKRRIMLGTFVLSASYYDAYFTKAQKVRKLIKEKTSEIFKDYDFIISPTAPTTAPKLGSFEDDPVQMYLADIFSVQANVVGIPGISVPNGEDSDGMPVGLQIMADSFEEQKLLAFAKYVSEK